MMRFRQATVRPGSGALAGVFSRLLREDDGQDLVEYAFLGAFIATAGMVVLNGIVPAIGAAYSSWIDPNVGTPSLWQPPEPSAGS